MVLSLYTWAKDGMAVFTQEKIVFLKGEKFWAFETAYTKTLTFN